MDVVINWLNYIFLIFFLYCWSINEVEFNYICKLEKLHIKFDLIGKVLTWILTY